MLTGIVLFDEVLPPIGLFMLIPLNILQVINKLLEVGFYARMF